MSRRLIRCPGSLHGGSGLRVTSLSISGPEEFNPWRDAVFGDEPVFLEISKPFSTQMKGEQLQPEGGHRGTAGVAWPYLMAAERGGRGQDKTSER